MPSDAAKSINMDPYRADIEQLVARGTGIQKMVDFIWTKYKRKVALNTMRRTIAKWGLKVPYVDDFKAKILEWSAAGERPPAIAAHLQVEYTFQVTSVTVREKLKQWKLEANTSSSSVAALKVENRGGHMKGITRALDNYRDDFMLWVQQGLDVTSMVDRFQTEHGLRTRSDFVAKYLRFWNSSWRGIETSPGAQFIPMDQRSALEVQQFENAIKETYQKDLELTETSEINLTTWSKCLHQAACYDRHIQGLIVKDFFQPGLHWSNKRYFDPLWVMGIQIHGCFSGADVDTVQKIMKIVDSLTPKVLEKVFKTLTAWFRIGIAVELREKGEVYVRSAAAINFPTTPPLCITKLLHLVQREKHESEHKQRLKSRLARVRHWEYASFQAFEEHIDDYPGGPTAAEEFSKVVLDDLKSWVDPGVRLLRLPALGSTEISSIEESCLNSASNSLKVRTNKKLRDPKSLLKGNNRGGDVSKDESREESESSDGSNSSNETETNDETEGSGENSSSDGDNDESGSEDERVGRENGGEEEEREAEKRYKARNEDYAQDPEYLEKKQKRKGNLGFVTGDHFNLFFKILSERVRQELPTQPLVSYDWITPTTGALLGTPPTRFDMAPWEPPQKLALASIAAAKRTDNMQQGNRAQMIEDAQQLIQTGAFALPTSHERHNILHDSLQYLQQIVTSATPQEKEQYFSICKRMCTCISRPVEVNDLPFYRKLYWCRVARDDDWWHCRRLLQMIALRYSWHEQQCYDLEFKLMVLLAAIEGGSTEALLWLIPLDHILEQISHLVEHSNFVSTQSSRAEHRLQQSLVRELTSFVHAVSIGNLTFRTYSRYSRGLKDKCEPGPLQKWYTLLYNSEPRCNLPSCLRLLPHPSTVKQNQIRRSFSVETVDARTGCRRTRSFIANNRGLIQPCLVSWLRKYEPNPILINAFLWYSNLYHTDSACKYVRGKSRENF